MEIKGVVYMENLQSDSSPLIYNYSYQVFANQLHNRDFEIFNESLNEVVSDFLCVDNENKEYNLSSFFKLDLKHGTELFRYAMESEVSNLQKRVQKGF